MKFPITISERQRGNPFIELLVGPQIEWTKDDASDFSIGSDIGVLFLSIKFHRKNPNYIADRCKHFVGSFRSRVLLLLVDVEYPDRNIAELTKLGIGFNMTTVLAFKYDEAARWIMTMYSSQESKVDELKAVQESNYEIATNCLHALGLGKKDAEEMLLAFGSLEKCMKASKEEIAHATSIDSKRINAFLDNVKSSF